MREIPLGVYVPGHSVIHRAAPGWKFIGLVVFIAVVSFASSAPLHGLSAIGVLFLAYAVAGIRLQPRPSKLVRCCRSWRF